VNGRVAAWRGLPQAEEDEMKGCKAVFLSFGLAFLNGGAALAQAPSPFVRETITCADMRRHPTEIFSRDIDLGTGAGSPTEVDYGCPEALSNLPFLHRLTKLSVAIRGVQRWPCEGTQVYALMRYQGFAALKAGFAPSLFLRQAEQAEAAAEPGRKAEDKLRYFTSWSLESRSNFRLHEAFLSAYARALPRLTEHYQRRFRLPQAQAVAVARHALMLFSDWAFGNGSRRGRSEALPRLVELSMDRRSTAAELRTALAATSPDPQEVDRALKAALLYRKPRPYLALLADRLETLDTGDESAIFFALEDLGNVRFLLERGADADYANDFGKTPLFYAIELGQPRLVELLLDHGAGVNHRYERGQEPEWPFGLKEPANAMRLKTDPCAYDIVGFQRTPLMHAAKHGDAAMLALLVRRGARIDDVDEGGENALDYARPANAPFLRSLGLRDRKSRAADGD
jgi:hypothetical protein